METLSTLFEKKTSTIVHMDMDTFFVSVERVLDPKLEHRPVIVGGNPFGRGVVAGCSYEARQFGVHSAQPIRQAYRLCPQAAYLHGNYVHYAEYSRYTTELLKELAPICEKSSVDEFYLDLSRTERLKGNSYLWAQEIRKIVSGETHLPISFGLATNKLIAKVATTEIAKRNEARHYYVPSGYEREFLSPFPIRALPSIGQVTEAKFTSCGIETIGQLALTPVQILERLFGKTGRMLNERANGIDYAPVTVTREQKSFSHNQTFTEDTLDCDYIFSRLLSLASQLAQDLRKARVFAGKITVTIRYSDFDQKTKGVGCSYTNKDQDIYKIALKLFRQLFTRRVRVRLIGIEATRLLDDLEQQFLFTDKEEDDNVYSAMDLLRLKYGKSIIGYAGTKV